MSVSKIVCFPNSIKKGINFVAGNTCKEALHSSLNLFPTRRQDARSHVTCQDWKKESEEDRRDTTHENGQDRSLSAPSPVDQFGPCGRIRKNSAKEMTIQDPASQRLTWQKPPLTVLVIKKDKDKAVIPAFLQLVKWFITNY